MKALKGTEIVAGRKIYFELQGPNGEIASKSEAAAEDKNGRGVETTVLSIIVRRIC